MQLSLTGRVVAITSGDEQLPDGGFAPARGAPVHTIAVGSAGGYHVDVPSPSGAVLPIGAGVELIVRVTEPRTARGTPDDHDHQ